LRQRRVTYQHDELYKTFATHQGTDSEAFSPKTFGETGGKCTGDDFAKEGTCNDGNDIAPGSTIIEQAKIGIETREGKIKRQKYRTDKIFNLFGQLDGKTTVVRTNETDEESTENGMDADGG
jgi:hypothetical protein